MAETMKFDLVSPERRLMQAEVVSVQLPGAEGDLTAMPNHAPLITTLRPGVMTVETAKGETTQFVVTGGFAELGEGLSVLAERALPREEMTQERYEELVTEAEERYRKVKETSETEPGAVDEAAKLLADMAGIGGHIGLSERQPNL
ncbi:F0F1 ATP synthase subunit epsilon [Roseivivax halodurans JCM 10272]|uniref:ATP synthase epsilon chain n=1 Tax=Roseivivax halodurans JCM 10272 TaxID=1449350 RepID=X7EG05_9RHOB|nr:F0F1 ATP synthase subunit epsilon [Roseivivax halodurans]ETX14852.1 F0F1 ATP synthase subunit epsilon [Roseivivax halodurans JCM 10272]